MQKTHRVQIDGKSVTSVTDFHEVVKRELQFPDYYGMNADALWDCLTESLISNWQIDISWKAYGSSLASMGEDAEILRKTLLDAQEEYPDNLRVTIET